ncbi:MAG: Transcriptional regulator, LysR family [Rhizobacter sp.]|nr:Transcriptional regulator, LysR family [Rhizobacter sp.]
MALPDIRHLDIGMLRTFDALLRERSVSRAAARLFLSQPAVSASLKRLRDTFADPLFTRTSHGVQPTARALALAPHVESVLLELGKLLDAERGFDPGTSDRIFRVSGSDYSSQRMLPEVCSELARIGSRVRVLWESASFATLGERLKRGDLDVSVIPRLSPPPDLEHQGLYEDAYCAVARRGHAAFAEGMTLEQFCDTPQVFFGYGTSWLDDHIDQVLARQGLARRMQVAVTSFSQMTAILARTDHLSVFPRRVAVAHEAVLERWPLPFDMPSYTVYLCWDRRSNEDSGVQWLREALASASA